MTNITYLLPLSPFCPSIQASPAKQRPPFTLMARVAPQTTLANNTFKNTKKVPTPVPNATIPPATLPSYNLVTTSPKTPEASPASTTFPTAVPLSNHLFPIRVTVGVSLGTTTDLVVVNAHRPNVTAPSTTGVGAVAILNISPNKNTLLASATLSPRLTPHPTPYRVPPYIPIEGASVSSLPPSHYLPLLVATSISPAPLPHHSHKHAKKSNFQKKGHKKPFPKKKY